MKKILVTILAFVYLSVSSGAIINMHYCMGKLMSWEFLNKQNTRCGSCGMDKSGHKGCCKDEQKILQIGKDQKVSEIAFEVLKINPDVIVIPCSELSFIYSFSIVADKPVAHAPPRSQAVPIFILDCNFRI